MKLREYKSEDAFIICKWIRSERELYLWSADRINKFPLTGQDIQNNYQPELTGGRFFPLTAVDDKGKLIGHFILRYPTDDDSRMRFGFVIVNPSLRGQGFGKKMLFAGLDYVAENFSADTVDLGVFADNESAKRCYEAVGFREYQRRICELAIGKWECIDMKIKVERGNKN